MQWQAKKYTGIDSTSMPVEKAQELFASLAYTLSIVVLEDKLQPNILLQKDFHEMIRRGQEILDHKRKIDKLMWEELCHKVPKIYNVYYIDTLKNLGLFFDQYEIYYEAHEIPCSIDYPLINPVKEELKGISFIEQYMNHLTIESQMINYFEIHSVIKLLENSISNYKEHYFNLCEPVLINAIGNELLHHEIKTLSISEDDIFLIENLFRGRTKEEITRILEESMKTVGVKIGYEPCELLYFSETITSLAIRIELSIVSESLSNIFVLND